MFPCFFSLDQCLSHSWTYFSCPLIFQKRQSRHQHISFSHFFVYSGDIQFVLPLTFIYPSLPSFLSVFTFFFICFYLLFLSISTFFFICLYLLFLSISTFFFICLTFFFICLYLLLCLSLPSFYLKNNLSFLQPWSVSFF